MARYYVHNKQFHILHSQKKLMEGCIFFYLSVIEEKIISESLGSLQTFWINQKLVPYYLDGKDTILTKPESTQVMSQYVEKRNPIISCLQL